MERMKIALARMTPGQMVLILIMAVVFLWVILALMIVPILNLLGTVFFEGGSFSTDTFNKLLKSKRAMKALRNSFILAPTLSITVGVVGISLVLITEYFDIKGAKILRLGYLTTLIYGGVTLVSGYKFIYGSNGILTTALRSVFPDMNINWFQGYGAVLFVMTFSCTSNHMIFLRNAMRSRVTIEKVQAPQDPDTDHIPAEVSGGEDLVIEKDSSSQVYKLEFEKYRISDPMKAPDLPGAGIRQKLAQKIMYVMKTEAPIHKDLFYRRLAPVFGNRKVTVLVKKSLDDCISSLLAGEITERENFLYLTGQLDGRIGISARVPAQGQEPRAIDQISPEEIRDAIFEIIRFAFGLSIEDVIAETSRTLGFSRTSPKIRQCLRDTCSEMLDEGILREADGKICIRED